MGWGAPDDAPAPAPAPGPVPPVPQPAPMPPAPEPVPAEGEWRRQDLRMLLVHPVKLVGSLLPVLLVLLFTRSGDPGFQVFSAVGGAVLAVVVTLVQWFTLAYRVDGETVQVRQGWLNRRTKTARLERVRTIDVEGNLLMRLLDLRTMKIGTGVDDDQVELEGLRTADAQALRENLLRRTRRVQAAQGVDALDPSEAERGVSAPGAGVESGVEEAVQPVADDMPEQVLATWDPRWLRFGPLGASGLFVAAAVVGFGGQFFDDIADSAVGRRIGGEVVHAVESLGLVHTVVLLVVAGVVLSLLTSTVAYLLGWWGLRVTRTAQGTLHVTRGLTTTRSATLEERKVRGVVVTEPWQQRWQRGASAEAVVTGAEDGSVDLLPTVPRSEARALAADVLGSGEPKTVPADLFERPLVSHGPKALRRMAVGALVTTFWVGLVPVLGGIAVLRHFAVGDPLGWTGASAWTWLLGWTALMAVLNLAPVWPAWRSLGHAVTDRHLLVRQGALLRRHLALECEGVLSWTVEQSFFQRRLGLCTAVATVAGGDESYRVPNLPLPDAVAMMRAVSPELVGQFSRPA